MRRRQDIIEATLRVMARGGLRAVTHRAVAAEAKVPLASTTYYFRDLEDLIVESFLHWSEGQRRDVAAFHARSLSLLAATRGTGAETAAVLADAAGSYVLDQVQRQRADRALEYAFLHEAVRVPRLRVAVERQQREHLEFLTQFHAALGSRRPALDAEITNSVLLGLEKSALLAEGRTDVRAVLLRYLETLVE